MPVFHQDTFSNKQHTEKVSTETASCFHMQRKQAAMNKCDFTTFTRSKGRLC